LRDECIKGLEAIHKNDKVEFEVTQLTAATIHSGVHQLLKELKDTNCLTQDKGALVIFPNVRFPEVFQWCKSSHAYAARATTNPRARAIRTYCGLIP
jgi:hypothetical protein